MNNYDKIIETLYIGNINALKEYKKFDLIVNCTNEVPLPPNEINKEYIRLPLNDTPQESDKLLSMMIQSNILEKIHQYISEKKVVLVHCYAGMQRSCATVACYLIKYYDMTPIQAIDFIKSKRPVAFPNRVNFIKTLNDFYKKCPKHRSACLYVARGNMFAPFSPTPLTKF